MVACGRVLARARRGGVVIRGKKCGVEIIIAGFLAVSVRRSDIFCAF
jgi:hypothetical protein